MQFDLDRIRHEISHQGINQVILSRRCERLGRYISISWINKILNKKINAHPSAPTMRVICDALRIDYEDVILEDGKERKRVC